MQLAYLLDRAGGVVREERRDLDRDPAVDAVGALVGGREEVRGAAEVGESELEESLLGLRPAGSELRDLLVVGAALGDRLVEDRRVRREARDRVLVDVALERPLVEQLAGDVVEPEALPELVEPLGGLRIGHRRTSFATSTIRSGVKPNFCCTSRSGADVPNVCMPMIRPDGPT